MKKAYSLAVISFFSVLSQAQYVITQKANHPGQNRHHASGFSVNGKGYIGTGMLQNNSNLNDWWEYNPSSDSWVQKANFPGTARSYAVGFSINGKGYLTCGNTSSSYLASLWEYNASTDVWTQKTSFPGAARRHPCVAVVNGEAYVGCGDGSGGDFKDFYKYNPTTDQWTAIPDFPGTKRHHPVAVSLGGKLYVGTGHTSTGNIKGADFYVYDPGTNAWTSIAPIPGIGRIAPAGVVISNKMIVMWGGDEGTATYSDYFSFDPGTGNWSSYNYTANVPLFGSAFFEINGKGYVGTGLYQTTTENEFYEIADANTTAVNEADLVFAEISVFPNPVSDNTTITLSNLHSDLQNHTFEVYDADGTLVSSRRVESLSFVLDCSQLPSGTYFYRIAENGKPVAGGRFVKV